MSELSTFDLAGGPALQLVLGADGKPTGARASVRIAAPPERVWTVVRDLERYPERIPMVHRAALEGDVVTMRLRFRIALFSAKFGFTARETHEEGRWLAIDYLAGEPANIHMRFELQPVDGGRATIASSAIGFDIHSLGWLVGFFLKHHPEIEFGVYPGSALALLESVRRAAEGG